MLVVEVPQHRKGEVSWEIGSTQSEQRQTRCKNRQKPLPRGSPVQLVTRRVLLCGRPSRTETRFLHRCAFQWHRLLKWRARTRRAALPQRTTWGNISTGLRRQRLKEGKHDTKELSRCNTRRTPPDCLIRSRQRLKDSPVYLWTMCRFTITPPIPP